MFEGADFPGSLDEAVFESWLEKGRESRIGYHYLIILWDTLEMSYVPVYVETREQLEGYERYGQSTGRESLVAVYDLYSESRVLIG